MVICSKCNAEVEKYASNIKWCKSCYNEHSRQYAKEKYHRIRSEWIDKLGGRCIGCGTDQELQFDHDDAKSKTYEIGTIIKSGHDKLANEMAKCVLRCRPCHIEKSRREGDLNTVEHGGGAKGKRNCKCDPCMEKKREYMRAYAQARRAKRKSGSLV